MLWCLLTQNVIKKRFSKYFSTNFSKSLVHWVGIKTKEQILQETITQQTKMLATEKNYRLLLVLDSCDQLMGSELLKFVIHSQQYLQTTCILTTTYPRNISPTIRGVFSYVFCFPEGPGVFVCDHPPNINGIPAFVLTPQQDTDGANVDGANVSNNIRDLFYFDLTTFFMKGLGLDSLKDLQAALNADKNPFKCLVWDNHKSVACWYKAGSTFTA